MVKKWCKIDVNWCDALRCDNWGKLSPILCLLILIGCSAFSYHYYGLQGVTYEHGTLLGPKSADDLPFSQCAPNAQNKHPCVVLFTKDFFAFKQEYEDVKNRLTECEKK